MNSEEREELLDQFLEKFSVEKLKEMTLDEYVIGGGKQHANTDSFCNWCEFKLKTLGTIGGPQGAYQYGIFRKTPERKYTKDGFVLNHEEYVWDPKYGDNPSIAFENIKKRLIGIVDSLRNGDFSVFAGCNIFERKVCFLYMPRESKKRFVPILSDGWLLLLAKSVNQSEVEVTNTLPHAKLYEIIMNARNGKEFWAYYDELSEKCLTIKSANESYGHSVEDKKVIDEAQSNVKLKKIMGLLNANHNLILHGAPGTGKTYAAKKIAARLIWGDKIPANYEEMPEFKEQCNFVQFHPSYDYTDFVEGLRPVANEGQSEMGFERCDGIFKEFCEKAVKNILDSKKDKNQLQKELTSEELLDAFLDEAIENESKFETKNGSIFSITVQDEKSRAITIDIPKNEKVKSLVIKRETMLTVLNYSGSVKSVKDIWKKILKRAHGAQEDSYIFVILSKIKKPTVSNQLELQFAQTNLNIKTIPEKNYVFIIDEINRGEASKIFGELFFSIDPGYRGIKGKVKTQYQNLVEDGVFKDGFYVPENVYIIGTMNDIDRSVESMDFAFRRRFAWYEVTAEATQTMLDSLKDQGIREDVIEEAKAKMNALNKLIADTPDLGESYQIGAAYFMKLKEYDGGFTQLWDYHLKGLLTDYLRGLDSANETLTKFKNAYDEASVNG